MRARKITNGGRKVIGKFPSLKMGKMVWWESQLERDYIFHLELDRAVISYEEQPLKIRYMLDREVHYYTPDFLVVRHGKKQIAEVKDEESANSDDYKLLFRTVAPLFLAEGYEFVVVTEKNIRVQPLLSNIKLLHKYSRTVITYKHQLDTYAYFANSEECVLAELGGFLKSRGGSIQVVYALIYRGMLSIDLSKPVNSQSTVRLAQTSALIKEKSA